MGRLAAGKNLFHLHIPKTAGTSLRVAFTKGGYKVQPIGPQFVHDPERDAAWDLFTGHAGYRTVEASPQLRGDVVTILRDPVDRVASYYYHLAKLHRDGNENSHRTGLASKYSLLEFLAIRDDPHLLTDLYNAMTWQLVFDADVLLRMAYRRQQPAFSDADLVERAKTNLLACRVVGFQDRLADFAHDLGLATGLSVRLGVENANPDREALHALDATTRRRIGEWIELDVAVYEWARANLGKRVSDPAGVA